MTAPGRPPSEPAGVLGSALGFWRAASDRLQDLDLKLSNQVGALGALLDPNPGPLHPTAVPSCIRISACGTPSLSIATAGMRTLPERSMHSTSSMQPGAQEQIQAGKRSMSPMVSCPVPMPWHRRQLGAGIANMPKNLGPLLQERAVAIQTGKVEMLKANYADGRVKKDVLDRQQSLLGKMTVRALAPRQLTPATVPSWRLLQAHSEHVMLLRDLKVAAHSLTS